MSPPNDKLHTLAPRHEISRRDALKLIGAGVAALSAGCLSRAGDGEIVPSVDDPPEHHPGATAHYASALTLDGFAAGVLVETHEGRPTKIDGNPAHPASAGGSTAWMQARILDLYDPQRSTVCRDRGNVTSWEAIATTLGRLPAGPLWLVMPPQSSPTIAALLRRLAAMRDVRVVFHAPLDHRAAYAGAAAVYGRPLEVQLDLVLADVLLALDAEVLDGMPMSPAWARAFAARRTNDLRMNRLWSVDPMETPTSTLADERIALRAGDIAAFTACVAAELAGRGVAVPRLPPELVAAARRRIGVAAASASHVAADLANHRGRGAIVVGDRQPPAVHALVRWIDHACGNVGGAVTLTEPALVEMPAASLGDLAGALGAGAPAIFIDCDPVYDAPRRLELADAIASSGFSLHLGLHENATSAACAAHVPLAHELEAWSDARAWDGTLSICQPVLRPRFDVASPIDVLAALLGDPKDGRSLVRAQYGDDLTWTTSLRRGVVAGTTAPAIAATPRWNAATVDELARLVRQPRPAIEIDLARSPQVHDGRFAPNAWLQELPHPITKQTWGNAALMSPGLAARLGVADEQEIEIATEGGTVELPVLVVPGAADGSVTVELGRGQRSRSPIADRVGASGYALRAGTELIAAGTVRRLAGSARLARTQTTFSEEGREIAPVATVARLRSTPDIVAHLRGEQASMLPPRSHEGTQWGMSIDTSVCTGCGACMIACQAENNVPTVGADAVARGRHMGWLRIDRYVKSDGAVVNEPMTCQHCENAPCEYACPVNATTHSPDGINEQVYNRCIGTRFCSNNCPYKVRRFNWFAPKAPGTRALQYNPDVTVRSRGVMEKCTYCVQRIRRAEHTALVEHRAIRPGEVTTACQQACSTGAIQFGELHEQDTVFARMRRDPRRFEALHDLGTRPRTQYLAKIRNPREGT